MREINVSNESEKAVMNQEDTSSKTIEMTQEDIFINNNFGSKISYQGFQEFEAKDFTIPNDISSASFLAGITPV